MCRVPVFSRGASDTENSLIAAGRSMIVENNYGYTGPAVGVAGPITAPGFARVDINRDGHGCHLVWTNRTVRAPTVVPKLSLANGLVYTYTKGAGPRDPWYWTALDFRTGRVVYQQLPGTGSVIQQQLRRDRHRALRGRVSRHARRDHLAARRLSAESYLGVPFSTIDCMP